MSKKPAFYILTQDEKGLTWDSVMAALIGSNEKLAIVIELAYEKLKDTDCPQDPADALMVYEDEVNKLLGRKIRE